MIGHPMRKTVVALLGLLALLGAASGCSQQLAQLDDLKARGRITEEEYATMRRRLVEGVTPGALAPPNFTLTWDGPVLRGVS